MGDSFLKSTDLLPRGVNSVQELSNLYESKRTLKKLRHLHDIPIAQTEKVRSVILTPDNKHIVSGMDDGSIKIFDWKKKEKVYNFGYVHKKPVTALAMTADGKYLVSGSADELIKIFHFETKILYHQYFHQYSIKSLAIIHDEEFDFIISACQSSSQNDSVKVFCLQTKSVDHHFQDFWKDTSIISMKAARNNKFIVVLASKNSITVLDQKNRQILSNFKLKILGEAKSIAITSDGNLIGVGSEFGKAGIISMADALDGRENLIAESYSKSVLVCDEGNFPPVDEVVFSFDDKYLFTGLEDGSLLMWNMRKRKKKVFPRINSGFHQFAVSKDRKFLIAYSQYSQHQSLQKIALNQKKGNVITLQRSENVFPEELRAKKNSVSISHNSKYILSATNSMSIKIFDSQSKEETYKNAFTFDRIISSIVMTPDQKFIIVALINGSIKIRNFKTREVYYDFEDAEFESGAKIAVSSDSLYLVFVSDETSLKIFNIKEKKEVHTFSDVHYSNIMSIAVTKNKLIVSASLDRSIKLFDIQTKKEVYHFKEAHKGVIYAVAVTANDRFIVSSGLDLSINIFDIETKQQIYEFIHAHNYPIFSLSISHDDKYIASGAEDGSVRVFDLETKLLVYSLQNLHKEWVCKLAFAPNNEYLVSLSRDGSIKFVNFKRRSKFRNAHIRNENPLRRMALASKKQLMLIQLNQMIEIYNTKTKRTKRSFLIECDESIKTSEISSDGNYIGYGTTEGSIGVFDIEHRRILSFKNHHKVFRLCVDYTTVAEDHPDPYMISGSEDKSIKVFILKTGILYLEYLNIHQDAVNSLCVTPDNQYIISGSADRSIKILSIEKKEEIYHFKDAHSRSIECVTVSSQGDFFASCSFDRSIKLFDFKTRQLIHCFEDAHNAYIPSIAISPNCQFIVSGAADQSIKIFDIQTKQQVCHFQEVHPYPISYLAITADNRSIISACEYGLIRYFDLIPFSRHQKSLSLPLPKSSTSKDSRIITKNEFDVSNSQIYYAYNQSSFNFNFNAVDDFLFDKNTPIQSICTTAVRCQNLTIYPYQWNILHLAAIKAHHTFIKNMPEYAQFKVPFLLDVFNKTPLHYLIAHKKVDLTSLNLMLIYICDYLDDLSESQCYQAQEIIISLTSLFWFIIKKSDFQNRERFLRSCTLPLPVPFNIDLPEFGKPRADVTYFSPTLESIYPSIDNMYKSDGEDQIEFRANLINLDFHVLSDDMKTTVELLSEQKNEDIFKTAVIFDLINHLWNQTIRFLEIKSLIFSAYIIGLSVYISFEDRSLPYEIIILISSIIFVPVEGLQLFKHYKDRWNLIDIAFYPLTIIYMIARIIGLTHNLVRAWFCAFIILFGYLRLISHLRIFRPTRNLIQTIVTVVYDMRFFMVIVALIISGFAFIFLVFSRGRRYGHYLYYSYSSFYFLADDEGFDPSGQFWIALIAFLLNIILLNLLISIIGSSYDKVLEKRIKTDSLTRLDLISETATLLKFLFFTVLRRKKKDQNRGFLAFCESLNPVDDDDDDNKGDDEEEKMVLSKDFLKQRDDSTKQKINELQQKLERIEEKRRDDKEMMEKKFEEQDAKMNQVLALLTQMQQQREINQ